MALFDGPARAVEQQAQRTVRQAAPWVQRLARLGYAAKGLVYVIIGAVAAQAAFGGRQVEGSEGALVTILRQPFGRVLLGIVALGLAGFVLWRLVQAALDPEHKGTDAGGAAKRVGMSMERLGEMLRQLLDNETETRRFLAEEVYGVPDEVLDELIGAAWIAIRTFKPSRRARCVAARNRSAAGRTARRYRRSRVTDHLRPDKTPRRSGPSCGCPRHPGAGHGAQGHGRHPAPLRPPPPQAATSRRLGPNLASVSRNIAPTRISALPARCRSTAS